MAMHIKESTNNSDAFYELNDSVLTNGNKEGGKSGTKGIFGKLTGYSKNVLKSTKNLAFDVVGQYVPNARTIRDSFKDLGSQALVEAKDYLGPITDVAKKIAKGESGSIEGNLKQQIINQKNETLKRLKSGNFYKSEKEKMDESMAEMFGDFGDDDFGGDFGDDDFGGDMDFSGDDGESITTYDEDDTLGEEPFTGIIHGASKRVNTTQKVRSSTRTSARRAPVNKTTINISGSGGGSSNQVRLGDELVSESVASVGRALLAQQEEIFNKHFIQAEIHNKTIAKYQEEIMNGVLATVEFNNTVHSDSIRAQMEYQGKMIAAQEDIISYLREIKDSVIAVGTYKPQEDTTETASFTSGAGFSGSEYFKNIKKNFMDLLGGSDIGSMLTMLPSLTGSLEMGEEMGMKTGPDLANMALKGLGGMFLSRNTKYKLKQLNKNMDNFSGMFTSKMNQLAQYSNNRVLSSIGKLFGTGSTRSKIVDLGLKDPNAVVGWTSRSDRTLNEVIPSYLSMLVANATGEDRLVYDYRTGKFQKSKTIQQEYDTRRKDAYTNGTIQSTLGKMNDVLDRRLATEARDQGLDEAAIEKRRETDRTLKKGFDTLTRNIVKSGTGFNPTLAQTNKNYKSKLLTGIHEENGISAETVLDEFISMYKMMNKSERNEFLGAVGQAFDQSRSTIKGLNDDAGKWYAGASIISESADREEINELNRVLGKVVKYYVDENGKDIKLSEDPAKAAKEEAELTKRGIAVYERTEGADRDNSYDTRDKMNNRYLQVRSRRLNLERQKHTLEANAAGMGVKASVEGYYDISAGTDGGNISVPGTVNNIFKLLAEGIVVYPQVTLSTPQHITKIRNAIGSAVGKAQEREQKAKELELNYQKSLEANLSDIRQSSRDLNLMQSASIWDIFGAGTDKFAEKAKIDAKVGKFADIADDAFSRFFGSNIDEGEGLTGVNEYQRMINERKARYKDYAERFKDAKGPHGAIIRAAINGGMFDEVVGTKSEYKSPELLVNLIGAIDEAGGVVGNEKYTDKFKRNLQTLKENAFKKKQDIVDKVKTKKDDLAAKVKETKDDLTNRVENAKEGGEKHASGGFIGGPSGIVKSLPGVSSVGDKVHAMLNKGELVLNDIQQSNIYKKLQKSGEAAREKVGSTLTRVQKTELFNTAKNVGTTKMNKAKETAKSFGQNAAHELSGLADDTMMSLKKTGDSLYTKIFKHGGKDYYGRQVKKQKGFRHYKDLRASLVANGYVDAPGMNATALFGLVSAMKGDVGMALRQTPDYKQLEKDVFSPTLIRRLKRGAVAVGKKVKKTATDIYRYARIGNPLMFKYKTLMDVLHERIGNDAYDLDKESLFAIINSLPQKTKADKEYKASIMEMKQYKNLKKAVAKPSIFAGLNSLAEIPDRLAEAARKKISKIRLFKYRNIIKMLQMLDDTGDASFYETQLNNKYDLRVMVEALGMNRKTKKIYNTLKLSKTYAKLAIDTAETKEEKEQVKKELKKAKQRYSNYGPLIRVLQQMKAYEDVDFMSTDKKTLLAYAEEASKKNRFIKQMPTYLKLRYDVDEKNRPETQKGFFSKAKDHIKRIFKPESFMKDELTKMNIDTALFKNKDAKQVSKLLANLRDNGYKYDKKTRTKITSLLEKGNIKEAEKLIKSKSFNAIRESEASGMEALRAKVNKKLGKHYATGGIVEGSLAVGDNIPIKATAGEMIFNKSQQKGLFNIVKKAGMTKGGLASTLQAKDTIEKSLKGISRKNALAVARNYGIDQAILYSNIATQESLAAILKSIGYRDDGKLNELDKETLVGYLQDIKDKEVGGNGKPTAGDRVKGFIKGFSGGNGAAGFAANAISLGGVALAGAGAASRIKNTFGKDGKLHDKGIAEKVGYLGGFDNQYVDQEHFFQAERAFNAKDLAKGTVMGGVPKMVKNAKNGVVGGVKGAMNATATVVKKPKAIFEIIKEGLEKFLKDPKVVKQIGPKMISKIKSLPGTIAARFKAIPTAVKSTTTAAKNAAKEGVKAVPVAGWVIAIGDAILAFASGWNDADRIFEISPGDSTLGMKMTAAITTCVKSIIQSLLSITGVGAAIAIGLDFVLPMDWLIKTIYELVASEADLEELRQKQAETEKRANALGKSRKELATAENRSLFSKLTTSVQAAFSDKTYDQIKEEKIAKDLGITVNEYRTGNQLYKNNKATETEEANASFAEKYPEFAKLNSPQDAQKAFNNPELYKKLEQEAMQMFKSNDKEAIKKVYDKINDKKLGHQSKDVNQLNPGFKSKLNSFTKEVLGSMGLNLSVTEGKRNPFTQFAYFSKGRADRELADYTLNLAGFGGLKWWGGDNSINTKTLNSNHLDGNAIDFNVSKFSQQQLANIGKIAGKNRIEWGGNWPGGWDKPHFEDKDKGGQVSVNAQKFATGGIVKGDSKFGDKVPIKVNSGEMVLTKGQQKALFQAINKMAGEYNNPVNLKESPLVTNDKQSLKLINEAIEIQKAIYAEQTRHNGIAEKFYNYIMTILGSSPLATQLKESTMKKEDIKEFSDELMNGAFKNAVGM